MAAVSPEAKARKNAALAAKIAADPAYRKARNDRREANRKARDPAKVEAAKERARTKRDTIRNARPFVGCDGEGAKDEAGRSRYVLFRMGDRELAHDDASRLTTPELLSFILDHPNRDDILVGFFFEYDISNILFDVPSTRDPAKPSIPSPIEKILQVDLKAAANDPNPYQFEIGRAHV